MPAARAAHTLKVTDTGHLHYLHSSGSLLLEEGSATGTVPGNLKVRFNVGATVTAKFTLYPRNGGSISGHAEGKLHSSGRYASFGGTMSVKAGSGRYSHAHGHGGFYGVIDRETYALTVQTTGTFSY